MPMKFIFSMMTLAVLGLSTVLAQDPVDSQVSPAVRALQEQGAREDAMSMQEPIPSPQVQSLDTAGAGEDAVAWHNLEGFVREKIKEGLRGRALGEAVRQERERLGLTRMNEAMVKNMREYERAQVRIEEIDRRLVAARAELNNNNPYSAGSVATSDSSVRSGIQKEIRGLESEKEVLENRSAKILQGLTDNAKF